MNSKLIEQRYWIKILSDSVLWILMTIPAFWLRLEGDMTQYWPIILGVTAAVAPLKILAIFVFGHHRRSWQYSSVQDLLDLSISVVTVSIIYLICALVVRGQIFLPLSIPVIEGILALLVLGFVRMAVRLTLKEKYYRHKKIGIKRVLVVGAGDAGVMIVREMQRHPDAGIIPVVFVDDAPHKWKQKVMGLPVAGRIAQLKEIAKKYAVSEVIIAMPTAGGGSHSPGGGFS